jgi:hypothetical protein
MKPIATFQLRTALLVTVALFLAACGSKPKQAVNIPADAQFVLVIQPKALLSKAGYAELSKLQAYQDLQKELSGGKEKAAGQLLEELLKNPENLGLDAEKQVYLFVTDASADQKFMGVNLILSDAGKFNSTLKDKLGLSKEVKEKDGVSYIHNGETAIVWNDEAALMLIADNMEAEKAVVDKAISYLKLDKKEGLGGNEDFVDFSKDVKDMGMWATMGNATKQIPEQQLKDLGLTAEDVSQNYVHGFMEFNDGELVYNTNIVWSKGLKKAFKPMAGKAIGKELMAYVPGDRMLGFAAFSIDMKNLVTNARDLGKKNQQLSTGIAGAEMMLSLQGLSLDKIADNFTGQFFVAVTDLKMEGEEVASKDKRPSDLRPKPDVLVAVGVNSSKDFQSMLETLLNKSGMPVTAEGKLYKVNAGGLDVNEVYYTYIPGYLLASNSKQVVEDATKGKLPSNRQVKNEVAKLLEGPVAAYMDFTSKAMPASLKEEVTFALLVSEMGMKSVTMDNNGDFVRTAVQFSNSKTNSLVSLLKLVDMPRQMEKKREESFRERAAEGDFSEDTY